VLELGETLQKQNRYVQENQMSCVLMIIEVIKIGNISGGNQSLRENYGNFNLSHMMLIQRRWKPTSS
jgi:hypothetical protein